MEEDSEELWRDSTSRAGAWIISFLSQVLERCIGIKIWFYDFRLLICVLRLLKNEDGKEKKIIFVVSTHSLPAPSVARKKANKQLLGKRGESQSSAQLAVKPALSNLQASLYDSSFKCTHNETLESAEAPRDKLSSTIERGMRTDSCGCLYVRLLELQLRRNDKMYTKTKSGTMARAINRENNLHGRTWSTKAQNKQEEKANKSENLMLGHLKSILK